MRRPLRRAQFLRSAEPSEKPTSGTRFHLKQSCLSSGRGCHVAPNSSLESQVVVADVTVPGLLGASGPGGGKRGGSSAPRGQLPATRVGRGLPSKPAGACPPTKRSTLPSGASRCPRCRRAGRCSRFRAVQGGTTRVFAQRPGSRASGDEGRSDGALAQEALSGGAHRCRG